MHYVWPQESTSNRTILTRKQEGSQYIHRKSFGTSQLEMNTIKTAFVVWNMFISWSLGFNLNPTIWKLDYKKDMTRRIIIEETLKKHIECKTRLISIAVRLEYSRDWEVFINQHLLEFLKNAKSMKFEIFNHRHERIDLVMPYNLWYVDSYRAFR